jgi:uncharacterized protein DUF3108
MHSTLPKYAIIPQRSKGAKNTILAVAALVAVSAAGLTFGNAPAMAAASALPWSDGDGGEMVTDAKGNKIKLTKKEKAAMAAELAPEITSMLADPQFPDTSRAQTKVDVEYVVYLGGFHLSTLSFSSILNGQTYQIRSHIRTDGFVDKFVRTNANIGSIGSFAEHRVIPQLYNSDITDRNQRQLVSIAYETGGPTEVLSFPKYNLKKHPVSSLEKKETVDPVSAIMQIALGASEARKNPCGGIVPVFDGRRRFNLNLEYVGTEDISTGKGEAYVGKALKCWVGFKRIAGYKPRKKKRTDRTDGRSEWPDVYMWLAPLEGSTTLYIPVRFQAHTSLGAVILRATKLKVENTEGIDPSQHAQN